MCVRAYICFFWNEKDLPNIVVGGLDLHLPLVLVLCADHLDLPLLLLQDSHGALQVNHTDFFFIKPMFSYLAHRSYSIIMYYSLYTARVAKQKVYRASFNILFLLNVNF